MEARKMNKTTQSQTPSPWISVDDRLPAIEDHKPPAGTTVYSIDVLFTDNEQINREESWREIVRQKRELRWRRVRGR